MKKLEDQKQQQIPVEEDKDLKSKRNQKVKSTSKSPIPESKEAM